MVRVDLNTLSVDFKVCFLACCFFTPVLEGVEGGGRFVCREVFVSAGGGFLHVLDDWDYEVRRRYGTLGDDVLLKVLCAI